MRVHEPFTGIMIIVIAFASYADGAIWQSGCCAGIGSMMIVNWLCTWMYKKSNKEPARHE